MFKRRGGRGRAEAVAGPLCWVVLRCYERNNFWACWLDPWGSCNVAPTVVQRTVRDWGVCGPWWCCKHAADTVSDEGQRWQGVLCQWFFEQFSPLAVGLSFQPCICRCIYNFLPGSWAFWLSFCWAHQSPGPPPPLLAWWSLVTEPLLWASDRRHEEETISVTRRCKFLLTLFNITSHRELGRDIYLLTSNTHHSPLRNENTFAFQNGWMFVERKRINNVFFYFSFIFSRRWFFDTFPRVHSKS